MEGTDTNQIRSRAQRIFFPLTVIINNNAYIKMLQTKTLEGNTGIFLFHNFELTLDEFT